MFSLALRRLKKTHYVPLKSSLRGVEHRTCSRVYSMENILRVHMISESFSLVQSSRGA